jgi:hypothetical protein
VQAGTAEYRESHVVSDEIDALIDLVKFDYEHTLTFIDGVIRVSTGIRTIAMAGCLALLAAAVQSGQTFLAAFALVAALALGAQDAYHGWLYAEARERASRMEKLLDSYYKLQGHPSQAAQLQLLKRLRRHRIGQRASLFGPSLTKSRERGAEWRKKQTRARRIGARLRIAWLVGRGAAFWSASRVIVAKARPRIVYWLLYPLLGAASVAVGAVLLAGGADPPVPSRAIRVCVACGPRAELMQPPLTNGEALPKP